MSDKSPNLIPKNIPLGKELKISPYLTRSGEESTKTDHKIQCIQNWKLPLIEVYVSVDLVLSAPPHKERATKNSYHCANVTFHYQNIG